MNKAKKLFIQIDEFIFHKLDLLKSESNFQKINEMISGLEDDQQKILIQGFTFFLILLPFFVVLFLWMGNSKIRKNIEVKNQIIEQIAILNGNRETLMNVSTTYIAPNAFNGRDELDNRLHNLVSINNIDQNKVRLTNYNPISTTSSVSKIEASIGFHDFGTQDFSNFIRALTDNERFKVSKINLLKNTSTNLLQGEIYLIHMGKNSSF